MHRLMNLKQGGEEILPENLYISVSDVKLILTRRELRRVSFTACSGQ